jgi:hypothetical protein
MRNGTTFAERKSGPSITWRCRCGARVFPEFPITPSDCPHIDVLSLAHSKRPPAKMGQDDIEPAGFDHDVVPGKLSEIALRSRGPYQE